MGDVSRYKRLAMRTKLNLVVFFVLLAAAFSGRAQGEFVAGYGLFSSVEVDNTFYSPSVSKIITLDEQYNSHSDALGPWVIGYKHAFGYFTYRNCSVYPAITQKTAKKHCIFNPYCETLLERNGGLLYCQLKGR